MAKYEVIVKIETMDDYSDGDQLEALRDDVEMVVADYDCFSQIGSVKIREIES